MTVKNVALTPDQDKKSIKFKAINKGEHGVTETQSYTIDTKVETPSVLQMALLKIAELS